MMLKEEEVDYDLIRQSKVFHFGTLSMTDELVKLQQRGHSPLQRSRMYDHV